MKYLLTSCWIRCAEPKNSSEYRQHRPADCILIKIIMGIISRLLFSLCYNAAPNLRAPPTAKSHFNLNPTPKCSHVCDGISWVISILSSFLDTVTVYPSASSCCCVSLQIIQGTPVTQSILSYKLLSPSSGRSAAPTSLYPACASTGLQGVLNVLEISFKPPPLVSYLAHFIFPFGAQLLLVASATHHRPPSSLRLAGFLSLVLEN